MSTVTELKLITHDIVDTNDTTFSPSRMIRGFNKAQDKVVNIILQKTPWNNLMMIIILISMKVL